MSEVEQVVEEQVEETTAEEITAVEETVKGVEETQIEVFKAFEKEEDYNKVIQSERSKAKGEILKELGYDKVADIKEILSKSITLEEELKGYEGIKTERDELLGKVKAYEDEALIKKVGIPKDSADMFFKLLNADDSELPREEKAIKIKEQLAKLGGSISVGTRKTQDEGKTEKEINRELQRL